MMTHHSHHRRREDNDENEDRKKITQKDVKSPNPEKADVMETTVDDNFLDSFASVTLTEEGAKPVSNNWRSVESYVKERHKLRRHSVQASSSVKTEEQKRASQHRRNSSIHTDRQAHREGKESKIEKVASVLQIVFFY